MASLQGLQKIKVVQNQKYHKSGIKSYVWLMQKWGFEPTMPGPYSHVNRVSTRGHGVQGILHKLGGKATMNRVLVKQDPANTNAEAGEVTADDQQNDSLYLCEVEVGTPPQKMMLDFDTGSSDLWLWSTKLPANVQSQGKGHSIFDPAKSSTFKNTAGSTWKISYGDGSSASGSVGTDLVVIGGLKVENQAIELASVLADSFVQGVGDGLLGLAWGSINTVTPNPVKTPVENMIAQKDIPQTAELFTAYLGSWKDTNDADKGASFYTFGYIDQDLVKASGEEIHYTPVDNSQGFWTIASTSATVNGKSVARNQNTSIMDTGTTLALIDDATLKVIYAAIPGAKYDSSVQGWIYPTTVTAAQLPVVTFDIGGKQFAVQKEDLGFAEAKKGWIYGGIQSRGSMTFDIYGDTILKGMYAVFDVGNKRFGACKRIDTTTNVGLPPS